MLKTDNTKPLVRSPTGFVAVSCGVFACNGSQPESAQVKARQNDGDHQRDINGGAGGGERPAGSATLPAIRCAANHASHAPRTSGSTLTPLPPRHHGSAAESAQVVQVPRKRLHEHRLPENEQKDAPWRLFNHRQTSFPRQRNACQVVECRTE
jgi:hypothetical protein